MLKANVCFKYFKYFRGMLQVFHMDVAKVDQRCCICCNSCTRMLQTSIPNVSSVFSDVCYKCVYLDVAYVSHICFLCMFKIVHLIHAYVAFKCFIFQRYVQRVMRARPKCLGKGHGEPGAGIWGARRAWGPTDGACSS